MKASVTASSSVSVAAKKQMGILWESADWISFFKKPLPRERLQTIVLKGVGPVTGIVEEPWKGISIGCWELTQDIDIIRCFLFFERAIWGANGDCSAVSCWYADGCRPMTTIALQFHVAPHGCI